MNRLLLKLIPNIAGKRMLSRILLFFCSLTLANNSLYSQQQLYSNPLGYGIKLGINYSVLGSERYTGSVSPNIGIFFNRAFGSHFSLFVEPSFSTTGIRDQQSDTRFKNAHFDLGLFTYLYPSEISKDFAFIFGLKPSYLTAHRSEVFEIGTYLTKDLAINENVNGQVDLGGMVGLTVAFSPVLNMDLIYNHSFTNQNTDSRIKGKPATLEIGIRINAVALKRNLDSKVRSVQEEVVNYQKGSLLVMLITPNQNYINRLKKENRIEEIKWYEYEIKTRNQLSIKAFSAGFNFCPVYFFMDTSVKQIIAGNFSGVFVNKNLQPDSAIVVSNNNYFVASFCEDLSNYTGRMHYGLFVYDDHMIQLEKPFNHPSQTASPIYNLVLVNGDPAVSRKPTYTTVPHERIVGKLNSRLFKYLPN